MTDSAALDRYESVLTDGLVKICSGAGLLGTELLECPDLEQWWDGAMKDYVADAVENFNSYPDAAIGWAAFLGMGMAFRWDGCWNPSVKYTDFYGPRGFDDMDEYIVGTLMHLSAERVAKLNDVLLSCSQAAQGLISHEGIQTQTEFGFYILARTYTVMFRLGASLELFRQGYKKVALR